MLPVAFAFGTGLATKAQDTMAVSTGSLDAVEQRVETAHSYTSRMCAASRWHESRRADSLFDEPQAYALAGSEGRAQCAPRLEPTWLEPTSFKPRWLKLRAHERGVDKP